MYRGVHEIYAQSPRLPKIDPRSGRLTAKQPVKQFISWVCYLVSGNRATDILGRRGLNARVADSLRAWDGVCTGNWSLRDSLWIELMDGDTAVNRRRREETPKIEAWMTSRDIAKISLKKILIARIDRSSDQSI